MEPFRLFMPTSFALEKRNRRFELDAHGISDIGIAEQIETWITELAGKQIKVIRTRDPFSDYVSGAVRRDLSSADGVLCIFTKRTKDHLTGLWIPSTYVISEASAAYALFGNEEETHRRLFGLVEEDVDDGQLGMAFHSNKTAPRFNRDDLARLKSHVQRIVEAILNPPVPPRQDCEYLSIDKTATICRNGSVIIETRHRFRVTTELEKVRIPHTMWRVSRELPELVDLLEKPSRSESGFLHVIPIACGHHDPKTCHYKIKAGKPSRWGFERNFVVEFLADVRPGDVLDYVIVWGYPNAFHNRREDADDRPNCVGLRTSGRGKVESASLTLQFERDLPGEPFRTLESHPQLFTTEITDLPGAFAPEEFIHSNTWRETAELRWCPKRSTAMFEVYHWATAPFNGMGKAVFHPFQNYFENDAERRSKPHKSESTGVRAEDAPVFASGI